MPYYTRAREAHRCRNAGSHCTGAVEVSVGTGRAERSATGFGPKCDRGETVSKL